MTSTGVGWVLLDEHDAGRAPLDHDAFALAPARGVSDGCRSPYADAVGGAQAIASFGGQLAHSIGVTWTDEVDAEAALLLESLAQGGFDTIVAVPVAGAAYAWAQTVGKAIGCEKTAVCVIESETVTVLVGDGAAEPVHTAVTPRRASATSLAAWLTETFGRDGASPDSLYLVGAPDHVAALTEPLGALLPMPVLNADDGQVALARGAALATTRPVDDALFDIHGERWTRRLIRTSSENAAHLALVCGAAALTFGLVFSLASRTGSGPAPAQALDNSGTATSGYAVPIPASVPPIPQPRLAAAQAPDTVIPAPAAPSSLAPAPAANRVAERAAEHSASRPLPAAPVLSAPVSAPAVSASAPAVSVSAPAVSVSAPAVPVAPAVPAPVPAASVAMPAPVNGPLPGLGAAPQELSQPPAPQSPAPQSPAPQQPASQPSVAQPLSTAGDAPQYPLTQPLGPAPGPSLAGGEPAPETVAAQAGGA